MKTVKCLNIWVNSFNRIPFTKIEVQSVTFAFIHQIVSNIHD